MHGSGWTRRRGGRARRMRWRWVAACRPFASHPERSEGARTRRMPPSLAQARLDLTNRTLRGVPMPAVCFYFQVHQPFRLRRYSVFDTPTALLRRLQERRDRSARSPRSATCPPTGCCWRRSAGTRAGSASRSPSPAWRSSSSRTRAPEVIDDVPAAQRHRLRRVPRRDVSPLARASSTPRGVPRAGRTAPQKIKELFGQEPPRLPQHGADLQQRPRPLRRHMGYDAILTEGADHILGYRSPNFVYRPRAHRT